MSIDLRRPSLALLIMLVLPAATRDRQSRSLSSSEVRADHEAFLSNATIVTDAPPDGRRSWRVTLASDTRRHDALVQTADGSDPTRRNYRFNVAAYELNKLLHLDLVPPSVERLVNGATGLPHVVGGRTRHERAGQEKESDRGSRPGSLE